MILFLGCVQCENPNSKIDNFVGNMVSFDNNKSSNNKIEYMEKVSLSPDNILLTGTQLKNTANVFGLCVYANMSNPVPCSASGDRRLKHISPQHGHQRT